MKKAFSGAVLLLYTLFAQAQTDSSQPCLQFKLSVNYNSYLNFYGRTDAVKSSGLFPLAELWLNQHFYVNAAPVFVNNATRQMDYAGTIATAGYQTLTDKWMANAYVLKPFYEAGAELVQSALKAQTGLTVSRLTPVINFTLGGDVKFSGQTDFGATAAVDKALRFQKDKFVFVVNPTLMAYAGTQRFTSSYQRKKTGLLGTPAGNETVTATQTKMNLLSYEASMPLIYTQGKWTAVVTPTYVVPLNLIQVPDRPDLSEQGVSTFYLTAMVKYCF